MDGNLPNTPDEKLTAYGGLFFPPEPQDFLANVLLRAQDAAMRTMGSYAETPVLWDPMESEYLIKMGICDCTEYLTGRRFQQNGKSDERCRTPQYLK